MKRSFLKRGLLLSAASATLLFVPAYAADLTISSATTSAVKTSTANNGAGDITINSNGSITITQSGPAVTLDSSNDVTIQGNLSNKNTTNAEGIVIDTGTHDTGSTLTSADTITGNLGVAPVNGDTVSTIDLSGSGTGKVGLAIIGNGKLGGNVTFGDPLLGTASMTVQGDQSTGILMGSDAVLHGNLNIAAAITMTPTTANETGSTGISVVNLAGDITGNVAVNAGSSLRAFGAGAVGVVSTGTIQGSFVNSGSIDVESFQQSQNQSTGAVTLPKGSGDPVGGPAVEIGGSILGGFMNSGADGVNTAPANGVISSDGGGASPQPIVLVTSGFNSVPLEVGIYTGDTVNPGYSFYNRGTIITASGTYGVQGTVDPNLSAAGVVFSGSSTAGVKLDGKGFFNSGFISVSARTTTAGSAPVSATALSFGSLTSTGGYVTVGDQTDPNSGLYNTGGGASLTGVCPTGSGVIAACVSGDLGGSATAIGIGSTSALRSITNSGLIYASAQTNNPNKVQTETAIAIQDQSGTLSKITNTGSIEAIAQSIANNLQVAVAADLSHNTSGVTFTNGDATHSATVLGDIYFGSGADELDVTGSPGATSAIVGNIKFGGSTGHDTLHIGNYSSVTGQINEIGTGVLNVTVDSYGALSVTNNSAAYGTLNVNDLSVAANGTLQIAVSTVLPNNTSISSAGNITLAANSNLLVNYSSFIPASGQFILAKAPTGHFTIGNQAQLLQSINDDIPFLFTGSAAFLSNQAGADELVLNLSPKTSSDLGLTGYAKQVFPYANAALENDDTLGAQLIKAVNSNADAQTIYSQFAPDASGGTRAIAISLTDHATGPVAARQRALRLYATQPGDLTLWGQEFAQQISDKGSDGLPGFKDSGFGFSMGADGGDALGGWYGGAFTFYTGNVDQRPPQSSRDNTQWYMLSGYSTWRGKGLFLDTQLTAGYGDLSAHRFITLVNPDNNTVLQRQANSKRSSALAAAGMTTGANLVYGSTTITPNIAIDGLTMREEGYTETGGGPVGADGFDLHVNPVLMSSLRAFVGVNARQDVNFGSFFMQPELRVGYRYDLLADRIDLTASFPGVTGTGPGTGDFTITGPQPTKGNLLAGASIAATTGAWSIGLNYDMLSGSNGSMTQVGTVSLVGRI